jgi:hypothetical protein
MQEACMQTLFVHPSLDSGEVGGWESYSASFFCN